MKNITLYKPKKGKLEKYVIRSRVRSVSELSVVVSKLITAIEAIFKRENITQQDIVLRISGDRPSPFLKT